MAHRLVQLARVAEAHLDLGRVHVDIDPRRVDADEQHVGRLARAVQHVLVRRAQAVRDQAVAHEAAVDIHVLVIGARAGGFGRADAAAEVQRPGRPVGMLVERPAVLHKIGAEHIVQPLRGGGRAPLRHQLAVMPHREADIGAHQRVAAHRFEAVCRFGGIGLQELAPRRRAEEQLAHLDGGADAARRRGQFTAACIEPRRMRRIGGAAGDAQLAHRRDGGQRLAAKAHRGHPFQIAERTDLAGGMALQRQRQLAGLDACTVVLDHDRAHATGRQPQIDLPCAGVECVVDQLAHHRRRPLDDLAGSDLADQFIAQFADRAARHNGGQGTHRRIVESGPHGP